MADVSPTDERDWLAAARRCERATFFHTPYWQRLGAAAFPSQRIATATLRLPSGTSVVLPMVETGRLGLRERVSTFSGAYGGPLTDAELEAEDALALQRALADWRTALHIAGNPLAAPLPPAPGARVIADACLVLDLEEGFPAVEKRFSKGHRSAMTSAARRGVSVRVGETVEDYRAYFGLYRGALERWGASASSAYGWELFAAGQELARELPANVRLWVAEHERRIVAGAWVFYWNRHAIWWHGAADAGALDLRPNHLLIPTIARAAHEEGYPALDMGATGGHEGPTRFKRHFGAREQPLRHLRLQPPLLRAAETIQRRRARD